MPADDETIHRPANSGAGNGKTATDVDVARDEDQTSSDLDQSTSDADQTAADSDQAASASDRALSRADQQASNRDQEIADTELEGIPEDAARERAQERSRSARADTSAARAATAVIRTQTAAERFDSADGRDEIARLRDLAAQARDRAADARDNLVGQNEPGPAATDRAQAAADRARAATDRERAAVDRRQAAVDRDHARAALLHAHVDELTGSYRRGVGTLALQHEIDRARRSGHGLVLAFVDVDGLKEINDQEGHAAGDALLIDVVETIRAKLRSYDPVVRYGGDEFLCALSDVDLDSARARFSEIQVALGELRDGYSISVGLAELHSDDTLEDLTGRGDAALYEAREAKPGR
jgi:diguanylate cyclase (GGDEF)-like protein